MKKRTDYGNPSMMMKMNSLGDFFDHRMREMEGKKDKESLLTAYGGH